MRYSFSKRKRAYRSGPALLLLCGLLLVNLCDANDPFQVTVRPFLQDHCVYCHDDSLAEGGLNLESLRPDFRTRPAADHWVEVLDRINLGEMPPQDEPRPDPDDLLAVTTWITQQITAARRDRESSGDRVPLRRMTRLEYARTVEDLLHVQFVDGRGPIDRLPPDGSIQGFDRNAKALLIDPSLMETYFDVAVEIADRAVRMRPPRVPTRTVRFEYRDIVDSAMSYQIKSREMWLDDETLVLVHGAARTFAKLRHPFNQTEIPKTGRYRVRIQAAAKPGEDGAPVYMRVSQGGEKSIAQFRVDAPPESPRIYEFETVRDELLQGEFNVGLVDGQDLGRYLGHRGQLRQQADALLRKGEIKRATIAKARLRAQGYHAQGAYRPEAIDLSNLPQLRLDWIEVTGPLQEDYPPESMQRLFFDGWAEDRFDREYVREIFVRLLTKAYRRPVTPADLDPVLKIVWQDLEAGADYPEAIKTGITSILCSPKFLFLLEPAAEGTRRLDAFELASRMSYLLWSRLPDDRLLDLAASGDLLDHRTRLSEVDRLMGDPRFDGFMDGFVRQWLKVDEFDRFEPDRAIYPQYYETAYDGLGEDMRRQTIEFVREMIRGDEPLTSLLDSDWTMLNETLANFYGIGGVRGDQFRRVPLNAAHRHRGGLMGMAGVHRWGSDGNRTKPVERGKYLLDVLFNDPPPPPPPNAGEVEPNIRGEKLTVAERLAKHREQTTCLHCHRRIDPYGLALENFNVIGQWRDRIDGEKPLPRWGDDRPKIVLNGQLPGGGEYQTYDEFKHLMGQQQRRFLRGVAEKLLAYALGRTIEPSDRGMIDEMVDDCQSHGGTLRSMFHWLVTSDAFNRK